MEHRAEGVRAHTPHALGLGPGPVIMLPESPLVGLAFRWAAAMNWDAIGAISELLGAIGVIASLVYLAAQIRHSQEQMIENTRALQAGTSNSLLQTPGRVQSAIRETRRLPAPSSGWKMV